MKKKEAANEKRMFEIAQENKRLSEPLTRALKEVELLRHELSNYDKDKLSLQNTKVQETETCDSHAPKNIHEARGACHVELCNACESTPGQ